MLTQWSSQSCHDCNWSKQQISLNLPPITTSITIEGTLSGYKLLMRWNKTEFSFENLTDFSTLIKSSDKNIQNTVQAAGWVVVVGVLLYILKHVYLWTTTSLLHQFICGLSSPRRQLTSWKQWQWRLLLTSSAGSPGLLNRPQQRWVQYQCRYGDSQLRF